VCGLALTLVGEPPCHADVHFDSPHAHADTENGGKMRRREF
jgi:hypothetical protein